MTDPGTPAGLPAWFEPLLSRLHDTEAADFTRLPTPDGEGRRQSAVLILFGEQPASGPDVLVLQRAATMRNHAGQPAFPGGAVDPGDADTIACALREAEEEVGLDPSTVEVVATLPTLWIPVSNFLVTPVLAWWRAPHPVGPADPAEVARVERLPIRDLADPAHRLRLRHPSGWIGPAFRIHDMLVWGFTAGVLSTLLELGGWAVDWPTGRVEELPAPGAAPVP
ncbi:NUDIX hydrolase [Dactylosporangium sucinum]|uniref:Coenzyme A pyrophosphatase n=1 Tax=Dactylosporangium sucinum TaxID=1424081 RepID=A0A917TRY9_9ACTN|nr:CoA pyrophosphatase [Dactylosporangium sucinum]GGM33704.1 coenzyme A pyrophosphatase [Dactylosporangium sucinum]